MKELTFNLSKHPESEAFAGLLFNLSEAGVIYSLWQDPCKYIVTIRIGG